MKTITILKYRILSWLYQNIGNILISMEARISFNVKMVEKSIGLYYNVNGYTVNKIRAREYVIARQVFATVLRNNTNMTFAEIGNMICNQSHDNMIYSLKAIDMLIETNKQFKQDFFILMRKISAKYEKYHQSNFIKIKLNT